MEVLISIFIAIIIKCSFFFISDTSSSTDKSNFDKASMETPKENSSYKVTVNSQSQTKFCFSNCKVNIVNSNSGISTIINEQSLNNSDGESLTLYSGSQSCNDKETGSTLPNNQTEVYASFTSGIPQCAVNESIDDNVTNVTSQSVSPLRYTELQPAVPDPFSSVSNHEYANRNDFTGKARTSPYYPFQDSTHIHQIYPPTQGHVDHKSNVTQTHSNFETAATHNQANIQGYVPSFENVTHTNSMNNGNPRYWGTSEQFSGTRPVLCENQGQAGNSNANQHNNPEQCANFNIPVVEYQRHNSNASSNYQLPCNSEFSTNSNCLTPINSNINVNCQKNIPIQYPSNEHPSIYQTPANTNHSSVCQISDTKEVTQSNKNRPAHQHSPGTNYLSRSDNKENCAISKTGKVSRGRRQRRDPFQKPRPLNQKKRGQQQTNENMSNEEDGKSSCSVTQVVN